MDAELIEVERGWKSVEVVVDNAKRQAKTQHKQLRMTEDELVGACEQIKLLKKLEDVKKAKDQAKQEGYDIGVAETKETLRAKVTEVCRAYCSQVWSEALNWAGVEASSTLRRAENVYYPSTIQALGSSTSLDVAAPNVASPIEEASSKDPLQSNSPKKVAEQAGRANKVEKVPKKVTAEIPKPSNIPKGSSKEGMGSQSMELVLATLHIPVKEDPKGKDTTSLAAATTQPPKPPKDNLVIKMKQ